MAWGRGALPKREGASSEGKISQGDPSHTAQLDQLEEVAMEMVAINIKDRDTK